MNKWIVVIITTLAVGSVQADRLEVIQLHNRTADEIIPIVHPIMKPGEAVTGSGFKLIVRASTGTVSEIKRILSQIDSGLKNLVVSVDQGGSFSGRQSVAGAEVRYGSNTGGAVSGYIGHGQLEARETTGQRIRVVEGYPAWINVGQTLVAPATVTTYDGAVIHGPVRHDIGTGFYVIPRVAGNRVNLEIGAYRESPAGSGPAIDVQSANTVVSGTLGEWIDIGGAVRSSTASGRGILSGTRSGTDRVDDIRVRVDITE